jgi:hypothetical protein
MYGLKEAAIIAFNQLVTKLAPAGYKPAPFSPGLWRHHTKKTTFVLRVDDFGVNYFSKPSGLTLDWHYNQGYADVSMPGYVSQALKKSDHVPLSCNQHAPHTLVEPAYGSCRPHSPTPIYTAPILDKQGTNHIQSISGTFLYYGRVCDPCILFALNQIASKQAKPTTDTIPKTDMLMDYLHTYPNAVIR